MKNETICVIGVSGYVGSHVAAELLNQGYSVNGTLRDPQGPHANWIHRELVPLAQPGEKLELFAAEISNQTSLETAMVGCTGAIMCAGVETQIPETITLMVAAAENTLNAALKLGIKRVVFTSSTGSTNPPEGEPPQKNELIHWSDSDQQISVGKFSPAAKTLMEKKALEIMDAHPSLRVSIMNPSMIAGPGFQDEPPSVLHFVRAILNGERMADAIPNGSMSIIDVNDLAKLHIAALKNESASGRYFALKQSWHWKDILSQLSQLYPAYTPPEWSPEVEPITPTGFDFTRRNSLKVELKDLEAILKGLIDELNRREML
ncbi:MAG: NAD-dependent epimerase/dehydratase family protein [Chloroflexota bacterium]